MIVPGRAIKQGFGVSLNGGEWRAQLVRNVSDKIPPGLFHALGFGEITQDRHRPAAGQWPRSHIERATWQNGGGAGGGGSSASAGSPHSAEEIRVSHRLDYRSIEPRLLWHQPVHSSIGPLHPVIAAHRDHCILHAIEQRFQLPLAVLQHGKAFFELARSLV